MKRTYLKSLIKETIKNFHKTKLNEQDLTNVPLAGACNPNITITINSWDDVFEMTGGESGGNQNQGEVNAFMSLFSSLPEGATVRVNKDLWSAFVGQGLMPENRVNSFLSMSTPQQGTWPVIEPQLHEIDFSYDNVQYIYMTNTGGLAGNTLYPNVIYCMYNGNQMYSITNMMSTSSPEPPPVAPDAATMGGVKPGTQNLATPVKGPQGGMAPKMSRRGMMREQVERMQKLANISKKVLKEQTNPSDPCNFSIVTTDGYNLALGPDKVQAIENLCQAGVMVQPDSPYVDITQPPFFVGNPPTQQITYFELVSQNQEQNPGSVAGSWYLAGPEWADRCSCTSSPYGPFDGGNGATPYNPDLSPGGIPPCEQAGFLDMAESYCLDWVQGYMVNSQYVGTYYGDIFDQCCPDYVDTITLPTDPVTPDPVTPDPDTMGGLKPGSGIPTLTPGKGPAKPPISTTATPMKGKMIEPKKAPMRKPMREQVERMKKLANIKKKK